MGSKRLGCLAASLIVLGACAPTASARATFRPRIGAAMGILPPAGAQETAVGSNIPVLYHGGSVMRDVTVHTIFWAPSGFHFNGPPSAGVLGYEQLIQQFLTDLAHDSGTATNSFSVLPQYADGLGPGHYNISYNAATDSIDDTAPFPRAGHQCPSPAGVATCVTDLELQTEINRVIQSRDPAGRGLHDIWFVFLPPDVDTCVSLGSCGTNAYAGYHGLSNLGRGATIYSVIPDPLIEGTFGPGADPQGNPDAESAIDTVAHETVEAITDPEGAGWMDPNGFEVGDKCQTPQEGTPLGFAANGSPYNQLINGHQYLFQAMWSNVGTGCLQRTAATSSPLPLATVSLRQFSPFISGNIGVARRGVAVTVLLARAGTVVAHASATTGPSGSWGPVALQSVGSGARHAVGDDRDEMLVRYGAGGPRLDLIQTGNGGNPFTQSGWTGWFDLDNGYAVRSHSVLLAPCSQVGVLMLAIRGVPTAPPIEQCETGNGVSVVHTNRLSSGTSLSMTSEDNRAVTALNPNGALVRLSIPLGEPNSSSALGNAQVPFGPTGFPVCAADLRAQTVSCTGLVPGTRYALTRRRGHAVRRATADGAGTISAGRFRGTRSVTGGDVLTLTNAAHRTLTTLHVAHLRIDLKGRETVIASGTCEPGDYYGPPLTTPPTGVAVGAPGSAGTGTICPPGGDASGLPADHVTQTDDLSGGQTHTRVPDIEGTSPVQDATLYGPFTALAQTGFPGPNGSIVPARVRVALTITRAGGGRPVFRAANVGTIRGVAIRRLRPGAYFASWLLIDANGDTRLLRTQFVQER